MPATLADAGSDLGAPEAFIVERHCNVLADGQRRIKRVELEDHGDVPLLRRQIVHAPPRNHDIPGRGTLETGNHAQRRRLAAARRAEQADDLACRHGKIDIPDGDERAELLGGLAYFNGRHGYFFTVPNVTPRSR